MSKVVKSVTRAIGKVVKGVVNVVKKVASSKLGKILITAAAVYFGGAALAGGLSSSAAGGSFLSGMGTGVANAASGLSSAWSSVMSGNFSQAGSALSSGFQGQAATGGMTTAMGGAGGLTGTAGTTAGVTQTGVGSTMGGAGGLSMPAAATGTTGSQLAALNTGVGGAAGGAAASGGLAEGLIGAAKITAGTQLAGGLIQGYGAQKAAEEQRNYEQQQADAARSRYNENVGTNWWGTGSTGDTGATSPVYAQPASTGLVAGAMTPEQQYAERMRQQMLTYNPYALPTKI